MTTTPDGCISYLKPGSDNWKALSEESYIYWRDIKANKVIQEAGAPPPPAQPLSDTDKKDLKENQTYINDFLLRSLQFPNLSFFAGSGTSLGDVGGPSMWDLWECAMLEEPRKTGEGKLKKIALSVCEKVKYTDIEYPNIEHFLSNCEAFLAFHEDNEVLDFLNEVKSIILNKCRSFLEDGTSDISSYVNLLQKMGRRRVRDPRLKVFTTNYDLTFETAASELGMMVVDGLSYTGIRRFDGKYFNYDVVHRDENEHEFIEGVFNLFKLHGSVSWIRRDGQIYENNTPSATNACLIYPAKGKYQQAFIQPHLELLSRLLDFLRKKNNCLVISGFGFNDDHLSEPIYSAIKSNPSMRLIVVDFKCATHINNNGENGSSKYWSLLKELSLSGYDIHFLNASFKDFVNLIPNLRALTPAEQLAKAIKQVGVNN
ncbi:TPA: SIR2 family protein [Serratia marcescens]|uniref:SIR2 family protein n=1 Tax=Serratia ureilytica TaxID=300181 RepID=UPI0018D6266E|nr:SIR2 family protein [Serratia ureilytica]MBH2517084.1 SIR2 family protein [Serratia ureilytica]MBH2532961.1 SIR2 family protein [Serratia ureilytica]HEJ7240913.1 SIR2 family protein [Serratia marcescens]